MPRKISKLSLFLSVVLTLFFLVDVFNKLYFLHAPERIFWYSTIGLFFTIIALISENGFLITALFCALFVFEGLWTIGFVSQVFFHKPFLGIASYAFSLRTTRLEFIITMYHLFFIPTYMYLVLKTKKVHQFGWIGASCFAFVIGVATYVFTSGRENINCIYKANDCLSIPLPLYALANPLRIIVAVVLLTLFIFIPTNFILKRFVRNYL